MEAMTPDASLDSYFLLLEGELRRHLNAFVAAQAQNGTVDVAGIASHDVRLVLQSLAKRWHTPQAATAAQQQAQKQYKKKNLGLEGSSVIAANFLTILTVLNCYHHRSETHWETIEQGHECALRVLRALRDKADIDTSESVRQLLVRWAALERLGDFAFDHRPKIAVADIAQRRPFGESSTPRLVLRGLPADATALKVMWTLQGQDIDVDESQIHLVGEADGQTTAEEPFVELKSVDDQRALLELGSVMIKMTPVHFVKPVESREAVLYLRKKLPTQALLCTWENEFGQVLDEEQITWLDDDGHAVALRLTPEQYAEVEGKQITLLRTQIPQLNMHVHAQTKIRQMQHHVKLLLPSVHMSTDAVRATVASHLAEKADRLTELIRIDDQLPWAVALLSSQAAKDALLQARYLQASAAAPTAPTTETTPGPAGGLVHRQWFPLSPGVSTEAPISPTAKQAQTKLTQLTTPSALTPVSDTQATEAPAVSAKATDEQSMQLKEVVMLHYLRKQRDLLDCVEREHSVKIALTLQEDKKAGFVHVSGCREPENAAWLALDAALCKTVKRQSTFKFQDSLMRTFFKRVMQRFYAFSTTSAVHVVAESGVGVGPVTVHMVAADARELEELAREVNCSRSRIVSALSPPLTHSAALNMTAKRLKKLEKQFDVAVALDPEARQLRVVGYRDSVDACLGHVGEFAEATANPIAPTRSPPTSSPASAHRSPASLRPDSGDDAEHVIRLWPRPRGMDARHLEALMLTKLGVAPTFIAVLAESVYVRYRPSSGDRALTAKQTIVISDDVSVCVEPFIGKLPSHKLCLQGNGTELAKLPHDQIETMTRDLIGSCEGAVQEPGEKLGLGKIQRWHHVVTVEVGTEARLRRLQRAIHWPVYIGGVLTLTLLTALQMTMRNESFDRTEPLADPGLAMYLTKRRDTMLADIERAYAVSIAAATTSATAREPKEPLAFVRIGGMSLDSVECAWQSVEAVIRAVVRKRYQFKFAANDVQTRACLRSTLHQLHESRECTQAIYVEEEPSTGPLVVHVLGDCQAEVDALDPNRIRTQLKVDRPLVLPAPPAAATATAAAGPGGDGAEQVSVTFEWALAEAGPATKLQHGLVEAKYNVRVQIDHELSAIVISGAQPDVARAITHIKKFMKRGAKMMAASSPVGVAAATTTTDAGQGLAVTQPNKPDEEEGREGERAEPEGEDDAHPQGQGGLSAMADLCSSSM